MKRYLIFGGEIYYARGGFYDFLSSHDDLSAALSCAMEYTEDEHYEWWHIYDSETKTIVAHANSQPYGAEDSKPSLVEISPKQ
jgi:hypothetical protein